MRKITAGAAVMLGVLMAPDVKGGLNVGDEKLELKAMQTPQISDSDNVVGKSPKKPGWLCLKFDFSTKEMYAKPRYKTYKRHMWMDEVTAEAEVLIPSLSGKKETFVLMTGKTVYPGIKMDGKTHSGRFFIPSYYFDRYLRPGNYKYPSAASLKQLDAVITLSSMGKTLTKFVYSNGQQVLNTSKAAKSVYAKLQQAAKANDSVVKKLKGAVLGADKSPWRDSAVSKYEFIKPEERGK